MIVVFFEGVGMREKETGRCSKGLCSPQLSRASVRPNQNSESGDRTRVEVFWVAQFVAACCSRPCFPSVADLHAATLHPLSASPALLWLPTSSRVGGEDHSGPRKMSAVQRKKFTQRNVFYLRASPYVVLQTILYLDYRHVEWMNLNPSILTQVLSILRTRIMPKLRKESDSSGKLSAMSKKERVDVYSDRDFQVAYFFRRMDDRHSVLLKEKSLVFPSDPSLGEVKVEEEGEGNLHAPIPRATPARGRAASVVAGPPGAGDAESSAQSIRIKDSPEAQEAIRSSPNASMAALSGADDNGLFRGPAEEDQEALAMPPPASTSTRRTRSSSGTAPEGNRRSKRVRIQEGVDVKPETAPPQTTDADAVPPQQGGDDDQTNGYDDAVVITEEDEEKMKPKLHVKYAGFRM